VPVLGLQPDGDVPTFLGTGFIVGDGSLLVTADHILRKWTGPLGFATAANPSHAFSLEILERDWRHDLALLRVADNYRPPNMPPLDVDRDDFSVLTDRQMRTVEYGNTRVREDGNLRLSPATRLGNVTRVYDATEQLRSPAGVDALELSFPALLGASGAPVFETGSQRVVGVIVASARHHLLPVEIETSLTDDNAMMSETKYLLPQALAVNIKHLQPMYRRHS
jgi:hypothetical protein